MHGFEYDLKPFRAWVTSSNAHTLTTNSNSESIVLKRCDLKKEERKKRAEIQFRYQVIISSFMLIIHCIKIVAFQHSRTLNLFGFFLSRRLFLRFEIWLNVSKILFVSARGCMI